MSALRFLVICGLAAFTVLISSSAYAMGTKQVSPAAAQQQASTSQTSQSTSAAATFLDASFLDTIIAKYKSQAEKWPAKFATIELYLFTTLAVLDVAWSGLTWLWHPEDYSTIWLRMAKELTIIGLFYLVAQHGPHWASRIVKSFMEIGSKTSGVGSIAPSTVIADGLNMLAGTLKDGMPGGLTDPGPFIVATIILIAIFICFVVIALSLTTALIEAYIVINAGAIVLGLAGSRIGRDYTTKYFQYAVVTGLKVFATYLMVGLGHDLMGSSLSTLKGTFNLLSYLSVLGSVLVFAYVTFKIPAMMAGLLNGTFALSGGGLAGFAAATVGAASTAVAGALAAPAVAASVVSKAGSAAVSTGAGVAGLARAGGALASAAGQPGGISAALGKTAAHLGQQGAAAVGAKLSAVGASFNQQTNQSVGGRLAGAIAKANAPAGSPWGGGGGKGGGPAGSFGSGKAPGPNGGKQS